MASSSLVCGICNSKHSANPLTAWCFQCNKGLCEECKEHHVLKKSTRNHGVIHVNEYQKLPISLFQTQENCKSHGERYLAYCHKHACSCCTKCSKEEHGNCKELADITYINDIMSSLTSSNSMLEIDHTLRELVENLKRIQQNRVGNLTSLKQNREKIEREIKIARQSINERFDRLERELLKELQTIENDETKKIRKILESVERKEKEIDELKISLEIIKQHASDLQTFLVSKQIEQDFLVDTESLCQSIQANSELSNVSISLNTDDLMKSLSVNISKFGEIVVQTSRSDLSLVRRKIQQKQAKDAVVTKGTPDDQYETIRNEEEASTELSSGIIEKTSPVYTSAMGQENTEEAYTERGEIVERTSAVYTSSMGQENRKEAYTEIGEIVEQTDPVYSSSMKQENREETYTEIDGIDEQTDPDLCVIVMAKPGKAAWKFGLTSDYRLYVKPEGFTLEDIKKRTLKCHWPYEIVQQYGKSKEGREFVITLGKRHILGPGDVTFLCDSRDNLERLFSLVPIFIKKKQSAGKP